MVQEFQTVVLAVAAVVAALMTIVKFVIRPVHRFMVRVTNFLDDWFGEDARPGHNEVKPMPERIATLEQSHAELSEGQAVLSQDMRAAVQESMEDRRLLHQRLDDLATHHSDGGPPPRDDSRET